MANRTAKPSHRTAIRGQTAETGAGASLRRYRLLAVVCTCVAVAIVLVVVVTPPDDARYGPSDVPASPEPLVAESGAVDSRIVLPATPAPATVEELKREALEAAEDLLARFPQSPEAHHLMALLQKALRQTDDAQEYWQKCLELAPGHPRARVGLARACIDQGNDEMAVETLEEALAVGCSSPEIYRTLATSLINLGRFEEAVDVLGKGLAAFPQSPKCWMLLGQAQIQRSEFQQAEMSLRNAIERSPKYTDAYYALATACARQGKHEEAAGYRRGFGELKARDRELEDRLALAPDLDMMRQRTAATLCGAGSVCFRKGDRSEAERLLLRAAAVAPGFPESYKVLASLYQGLGRIPDALVVERRLVEIEPQNVVNYVNLASLSLRVGDMASAEEALKQAIDLRPDSALAYSYLAQLYLRTGKPEQARSLAREAVRREATAAGYVLLASACRKLDDRAGAEAAFAEARRLASDGRQLEGVEARRP